MAERPQKRRRKPDTINPKPTPCPITRAAFLKYAKALRFLDQEGRVLAIGVKEFGEPGEGSLGWWLQDKLKVNVGGVEVKCQLQVMAVIVNSKGTP